MATDNSTQVSVHPLRMSPDRALSTISLNFIHNVIPKVHAAYASVRASKDAERCMYLYSAQVLLEEIDKECTRLTEICDLSGGLTPLEAEKESSNG